ncbi:MAG: Zn-dependent exopeptidase M28 [Geodermatophilales bacterium]|nr:Zn-dependent exopeptidase M28 [Geodermatophilales bacterium]
MTAEPWARLGGQVLEWDTGAAARTGPPALVTQVGRSFQLGHPEVPVLLDHGRHLVIVPPADGVAVLEEPGEHLHWRVEPLPAGTVVVDRPRSVARETEPVTSGLVAQLSQQSFEQDLAFLAGLPTRHSLSAGFRQAADRTSEQLTNLGFAVTRPSITVNAGTSSNVVADRPGSGTGDRGVVLVTAHLDSINIPGGPTARAPGADDNGSGAAGVLELARVLGGQAWQQDLRVILFGGEEEGLFGSRQYVAGLSGAERSRIRAVLNLDMVGSLNTAAPTVLLEGAALSTQMIDDLAAAAATYTDLVVETSLHPFASDHVPFIDARIPAVLTIEGADSANGNIHSDRDVLATVTPELALRILAMDLAALAGWLRAAEAGPDGQNKRADGSSVPLRTA